MRDLRRLFPLWLLTALLLLPRPAAATPVPLDRIVAIVNNGVIVRTELDQRTRTIEAQLRQQGVSLPSEAVLRRQVLERMIMDRIQLQLAARSGIHVDNDTLNNAMRNIAGRNHLTLNQFRDTLERDGYNYDRFRQNIREEITISRLHQREVADRVTVTSQEVDNFLATMKKQADRNKEFHLAHILIAVPEAPSPEQIETARAKAETVLKLLKGGADFEQTAIAMSDGQQALKGGDLGWRKAGQLPSLFAEPVERMKPGEISGLIRSPSGFHIIKLIAVRGEQPHIITQFLVRHIVIRTDQLVSDSDARNELEQLRARILGGDDFAALARAHSQDPATAPNGGTMGWLSADDVGPRVTQVLESLKPGEVSEPFRTQLGWQIMQVVQRRQHDSTAEFQRARAREVLRKRKTEEELGLWLRRLRDESYVVYRLKAPAG
ncbi:MAG: peptidylprolyl isomerase [Gammaproteobacteria bacterium]